MKIKASSIKGHACRKKDRKMLRSPEGQELLAVAMTDLLKEQEVVGSREKKELERQLIISEFLTRAGQYVTNDASREAVILAAVKSHITEINKLRGYIDTLIRHIKKVIGEHNIPDDCFSSGPFYGDSRDAECPACAALRFINFDVFKSIASPHRWDSDGESCEGC